MKTTLSFRLGLLFLCVAVSFAGLGVWLSRLLGSAQSAWLVCLALAIVPAFWLGSRVLRPVQQVLRALSGTVASYREGNFSQSLVVERSDELGDLMLAHNELAAALRTQRAHLVQRELLLDTVMQNSPVALVLVDVNDRIAYANLASRQILSEGRSLNGLRFSEILQRAPPALQGAAAQQGDSLFAVEIDGVDETFHFSQRAFVLQGRPYKLYLLKRLTRELSRQEVSTWKKLIRVLSHELNNSLGPLSSLAHTGAEIARREDYASLPAVFSGHRRARGTFAPFRRELRGVREIARASCRVGGLAEFRGRSGTSGNFQERWIASRCSVLVRSRAARAGAHQSAQECPRGRWGGGSGRTRGRTGQRRAAHRSTRSGGGHEPRRAGARRCCLSIRPSAAAPAWGWRWREK